MGGQVRNCPVYDLTYPPFRGNLFINMGCLDKSIQVAKAVATAQDIDIYLYNAGITKDAAETFCCQLRKITPKRTNAALILTTKGGDPDGAFLIARCLQRAYGRYSVYIFGPCKSAGTLIVVGAHEIIMSDSGELGPLDIQIGKDDELFVRSSGLDLTESIRHLRDLACQVFLDQFVRLKAGSSITTKTAAEIAQSIALGLVTPILSQIDPIKLGEVQRSMRIARDYAKILKRDFEDINALITDYPSHGFVIDREQAKNIFKVVRSPADKEMELSETLGYIATHASDQEIIEMLTPPEPPQHQAEPIATNKPSELKPQNENNDTQSGNGNAGAASPAHHTLASRH